MEDSIAAPPADVCSTHLTKHSLEVWVQVQLPQVIRVNDHQTTSPRPVPLEQPFQLSILLLLQLSWLRIVVSLLPFPPNSKTRSPNHHPMTSPPLGFQGRRSRDSFLLFLDLPPSPTSFTKVCPSPVTSRTSASPKCLSLHLSTHSKIQDEDIPLL